MGQPKQTFSNVIWFTALGFLRPAISIFLLPLYLIKITPADYGILALVTTFSALVATIASLQLDLAAKTFYFDYYKDQKALKNYLGQIFSINFCLAVCFLFVLILSGPYLFQIIFKSDVITFLPYGLIAIGTVLFNAGNSVYFGYLKNELKVKEFAVLSVISILLTIILQAIFILHYEMGILGILYGGLFPVALVYAIILFRNFWLLNFRFNWQQLKPSFAFGFGFLPISFLVVFEKQIDRLIIERYLSLDDVGLYALLISIIGFFVIFVTAYHNAIRPELYKSLKAENNETKTLADKILKTYTLVGIFALAGILVVGNHFHLITDNPKYLSIRKYFPYAIAATIPMIFVRFQILIILFYKKTFHMSMITLAKTIIMILLMIYLIPKYEIYGAILSLAISYLLYYSGLSFINKQVTNIKVNYFAGFLRCFPFLLLLILHLYLAPIIGGSLSSLSIFCITSIYIGIIEKENIIRLIQNLKK